VIYRILLIFPIVVEYCLEIAFVKCSCKIFWMTAVFPLAIDSRSGKDKEAIPRHFPRYVNPILLFFSQ
jgi:hypothetical protein